MHLNFITVFRLCKQLQIALILFVLILKPFTSSSQTVLAAGDLAITGFTTSSSNDAMSFVVLKELDCGTTFTVTDNNWRTSTSAWYCSNDEFGIGFTCTSIIPAGTKVYIEVNPICCLSITPFGTMTFTNLGNPWGTNTGFNSGGDNCFIVQGTYASPTFIFGLRHSGTFASGGDCSAKDNTGLPAGLTLGSTAVEMASSQNFWRYNCAVTASTSAALLTAIGTQSNWASSSGGPCNFTVTNASYNASGALSVSGAGCGCQAGCNETTIGGPNCGAGQTGNCTAGSLTVTTDISVPSGCTYIVTATTRLWSGAPYNCGSGSGADSDNKLKVDVPAGAKGFQTGASDGEIDDFYQLTGAGTIRVTGIMNRADEVVLYRIFTSPCGTCGAFVLPIELSRFNAEIKDKNVQLTWATESEHNNDYFTIERSADAATWEDVIKIKSKGNSQSQMMYATLDTSPLSGVSYYRLKQTDYDGQYKYSDIVAVDLGNKQSRKVIRTVNMFGQETQENASGLLIQIYDNGDVEKVYKNGSEQ